MAHKWKDIRREVHPGHFVEIRKQALEEVGHLAKESSEPVRKARDDEG